MNESASTPVTAALKIVYRQLPALSPATGYFHAKWRSEETAAVDLHRANLSGEYNYPILDVQGEGRYIGANLNVFNKHLIWWGEGDPMIYVDNEHWPPSIHGTGTEEYFNDAWGFHEFNESVGSEPVRSDAKEKQRAITPISGALIPGLGAPGRCFGPNTIFSFHVADSIPFRKRILVTIEHGTENNLSNYYSSTAYWYARPGGSDFFAERPARERTLLPPEAWPAAQEETVQRTVIELRREVLAITAEMPTRRADLENHLDRIRLLRLIFQLSDRLGIPPSDRAALEKQWSGARKLPMRQKWPVLDAIYVSLGKVFAGR